MSSIILTLLIINSLLTVRSEIDKHSLNSLAELPLEKLLYVKHALESTSNSFINADNNDNDDDVITIENDDSDDGLPFKSQKLYKQKRRPAPIRRSEWEEDYHKGGKKKDLSTILQTTITVLSFLAFGAYLLCMIITALRNYNMNTNTMTTTPASATIITGKRRRRRKRNVIEEESLDELLLTLYNLAEGYVKYHNNDL